MAMKKKAIVRLVSSYIMRSMPICILALALALVVLVGSASSQRVDYSGYTEYDNRPATLTLTFNGPVVTGNLYVRPVCDPQVHLTGVDIQLFGTATGPWENTTTTIAGNWNGGDTDPCDASKIIKYDPQFPNTGTFTISMIKTADGKDAVRLVKMPTGYGYIFESKGNVYAGGGGGGVLGSPKLIDHAIASEVLPGGGVINRTNRFSTGDSKVYSWLNFSKVYEAHDIEWRWYSPNGSLYYSIVSHIPEPKEYWEWYRICAFIYIRGYEPANLTGNWHVDIYLDDQKLLTEHFTIEGVQPCTIDYSGYTEYDGRPATLTLTFNGPVVTGNLYVRPVCDPQVHLTGVDIQLFGTATGPWENTTTIIAGNWNGGDTDPCDASKIIKNDPLFPNTGTFTISMIKTADGKDAVRLVRMPTGYGYIFESTGKVCAGGGGGVGVDLKIVDLSVPTGIVPGIRTEILVTFINNGAAAAGPFKALRVRIS